MLELPSSFNWVKLDLVNSPKKWWWTQSGTNLAAYSQALQMWAFKSNPLSIFYNWWSNFSRACNFQGNRPDLYSPIANLWGSRSRSCYQTASPLHRRITNVQQHENTQTTSTLQPTPLILGASGPHKRLIIFATIQTTTQSFLCSVFHVCLFVCVLRRVCECVRRIKADRRGWKTFGSLWHYCEVAAYLRLSARLLLQTYTFVYFYVYICRLLLLCTSLSTSLDFYFYSCRRHTPRRGQPSFVISSHFGPRSVLRPHVKCKK